MRFLRKKKKNIAPAGGGSIQERIDAERQKRREDPSLVGRVQIKGTPSIYDVDTPATGEDVAFLEGFQQHMLERRVARGGADMPDNLVPPTPARPTRVSAVPPRRRAPGATAASTPSARKSTPARATSDTSLPDEGALLRLATGEIVIFDRNVPNQCYQMVLILQPDGSLTPEGLNLTLGCEYRVIGQIPPEEVVNLHIARVWHRSHIVFYLKSFEDAHLIPDLGEEEPTRERHPATRTADWPEPEQDMPLQEQMPTESEIAAPSVESGPFGLLRGQRFKIGMGKGREWDAVYWGGQDKETLILHKTHGDWALMHLDMRRFTEDKVKPGEVMTEREMWELRQVLERTYS